MKLSALYCNNDDVFPDIQFGDELNVIFAKVRDPAQIDVDAHNLGKTFLIQVIDFALLGGITKAHAFRKHDSLFSNFVFYMTIETDSQKYVTVRRPVTGKNSVFIHVSETKDGTLRDMPDENWTYQGLGIEKARLALDELLNLSVLRSKDIRYRKGLVYLLRSQADYADEFRLRKHAAGKDRDWKPYLAHILGFDSDLVRRKYEIEEEIETIHSQISVLEREANVKSASYDELAGSIEIREDQATRLRSQVESFRFRSVETNINEELINDIETKISDGNERVYRLEYEISEIDKSIRTGFDFDLDRIKAIFEEVSVTFPDNITKSYEELVLFNKKISAERNKRLSETRQELIEQLSATRRQLVRLDNRRQDALSALREKKVFEKYRGIQLELLKEEEQLLELKQRLKSLDATAPLRERTRTLATELDQLRDTMEQSVRNPPERFSSLRRRFARYVKRIIEIDALLTVNMNTVGNMDFSITTIKGSGSETSQGLGTSYKKIICACFDMAVLSEYSGERFYHFVYHDGVFEGLDNRRKANLIATAREFCAEFSSQYILTVIDSDLPRDESDNKVMFDETDIVRELSDSGEAGRLFRMARF